MKYNQEPIPVDWPHVIAMIYQVRCDLFHGGKNYSKDRDRLFISLAYRILWEVWKDELSGHLHRDTMSWERILVRSGFLVRKQRQGFSLEEETSRNRNYLEKLLAKGGFGNIRQNLFIPNKADVDESLWLTTVDKTHAGAEGGQPDDLEIMDTYMAGLIRWLDYIGIKTTFSCDGHGKRLPQIDLAEPDADIALWILNTRFRSFRKSVRNSTIYYGQPRHGRNVSSAPRSDPKRLLDVAEWLYEKRDELKDLVEKMRGITERDRSKRRPY
jgi:hypothetical protein